MLGSISRSSLLLASLWASAIIVWGLLEFMLNATTPPRAVWVFSEGGYMKLDWIRVSIAAILPAALILLGSRQDIRGAQSSLSTIKPPRLGLLARLWLLVAVAWSLNVVWHVYVEWEGYDPKSRFGDLALRDWLVPSQDLGAGSGELFGKPVEIRLTKLLAAVVLPLLALAISFRWAARGLHGDILAALDQNHARSAIPDQSVANLAADTAGKRQPAQPLAEGPPTDRQSSKAYAAAAGMRRTIPPAATISAHEVSESAVPASAGAAQELSSEDRSTEEGAVETGTRDGTSSQRFNESKPHPLTYGDWAAATVCFLLPILVPFILSYLVLGILALFNLARGAPIRARLYAIVFVVQVVIMLLLVAHQQAD